MQIGGNYSNQDKVEINQTSIQQAKQREGATATCPDPVLDVVAGGSKGVGDPKGSSAVKVMDEVC